MESISFPGQTTVNELSITSHDDKKIDVSSLVTEVNIFEDLYATTMSGYMVLTDAIGVLDALPLIGQETTFISFKTPTLTAKIEGNFYIYKMSVLDRSPRSATYMLSFCSPELINSMNFKLAKSFSGVISDSVEAIFYDETLLNSSSKLDMIVTKNSLKFITPYWTPLEAINWLTTKSIAHDNTADFIFYQDNQKFNFKPISTLYEGPVVRDYAMGDMDANSKYGASGNIAAKYGIVEMMHDSTTFDYMRALASGAYSSNLQTFDATTRSIKTDTFDYIKDFDSLPHLNAFPIRTQSLVKNRKSNSERIIGNGYRNGKYERQSFLDGYLTRTATVDQQTTVKLSVKTFGRTDTKVGDVVKFQMPDNRQIATDDIKTKAKSDYYSGKYLITAIRHQFVSNQHTMYMEIASDSFTSKI